MEYSHCGIILLAKMDFFKYIWDFWWLLHSLWLLFITLHGAWIQSAFDNLDPYRTMAESDHMRPSLVWPTGRCSGSCLHPKTFDYTSWFLYAYCLNTFILKRFVLQGCMFPAVGINPAWPWPYTRQHADIVVSYSLQHQRGLHVYKIPGLSEETFSVWVVGV